MVTRVNILCTDCSDIDAYLFPMTKVVEVDFTYRDLGVSNQDFPGSQGMDRPVNDKHWSTRGIYIEPSLAILHPFRTPFKHEHDDSSFWRLSYLSVGVP
jgi:hypothetical protein